MRKKLLLTMFLFAVFLTSCSKRSEMINEAKEYYTYAVEIMDRYNTDLEKSEKAEDFVKAMETYADMTNKQAEMAEKLRKKYPGKDLTLNPPDEVGDLKQNYLSALRVNSELILKILQFQDNPDIVEAMNKTQESEKRLVGIDANDETNQNNEEEQQSPVETPIIENIEQPVKQ